MLLISLILVILLVTTCTCVLFIMKKLLYFNLPLVEDAKWSTYLHEECHVHNIQCHKILIFDPTTHVGVFIFILYTQALPIEYQPSAILQLIIDFCPNSCFLDECVLKCSSCTLL